MQNQAEGNVEKGEVFEGLMIGSFVKVFRNAVKELGENLKEVAELSGVDLEAAKPHLLEAMDKAYPLFRKQIAEGKYDE